MVEMFQIFFFLYSQLHLHLLQGKDTLKLAKDALGIVWETSKGFQRESFHCSQGALLP